MKTTVTKKQDIKQEWYVVDAEGKILGRLATRIATILNGKNKPYYTKNLNCGDFVIVVNADKIKVTGKKVRQKMYYRHSGYPGGLKAENFKTLLNRKPGEIIRRAVKGMLPKNRLGRKMIKKLKIYAGPEHPHSAQKPKKLEI